jgi:hypothetical protein
VTINQIGSRHLRSLVICSIENLLFDSRYVYPPTIPHRDVKLFDRAFDGLAAIGRCDDAQANSRLA